MTLSSAFFGLVDFALLSLSLCDFLCSSDFRLDMVDVLRTEAASKCFSSLFFEEGMVSLMGFVNFGVGSECH